MYSHDSGTRPRPQNDNFNPMAIDSMLNEEIESNRQPLHSMYRQRGNSLEIAQREPRPQLSRRQTHSCMTGPLRALVYYPEQTRDFGPPGWQASPATSPRDTARPQGARASRPKYEEQQGFWIWYHRTDLGEPWDQVLHAFKLQFGQSRPKGGLQCKFYRLLDTWKVEKVRTQTRNTQDSPGDRVGAYGVVQRTNMRFEWMKPEHYHAPALPQFRHRGQSPTGSAACPGCPDCVR